MTVQELIGILKGKDQTMEVRIGHEYGDRAGTTIATEPWDFREVRIAHSNYHDAEKVVDDDYNEGQSWRTLLIEGP